MLLSDLERAKQLVAQRAELNKQAAALAKKIEANEKKFAEIGVEADDELNVVHN